ncbi:hypothetical protein L1887_59656 [Cichorium endivia]|nr:hypothetical protein L1887_59656 [Cichorium endivia]
MSLRHVLDPHLPAPRSAAALGDWASGLLPWSGGGASRKSGSQHCSKHGQGNQSGPTARWRSPQPPAPRTPSAPSVRPKVPRQLRLPPCARAFGRYTRSSPTPEPAPSCAPAQCHPTSRHVSVRRREAAILPNFCQQQEAARWKSGSLPEPRKSSADAAPSPARRDRARLALALSTKRTARATSLRCTAARRPVPGFAASGLEAKPADEDTSVIIRLQPATSRTPTVRWKKNFELLTDRYGFIYNPTDADIRLLRQARKASAPAPATLTGIKVGIRARGGATDSQSEDDKNDPDLDMEDSDEDDDARLAHPIDAQERRCAPRSAARQRRLAARCARLLRRSGGGHGSGRLVSVEQPGEEARSWLWHTARRPAVDLQHGATAVDAAQGHVRIRSRWSKSSGGMASSSAGEHGSSRARARPKGLAVRAGGAGVGGVAVAKVGPQRPKTKALFAGGLFGAAHADGSEAAGSAEKAPEEDWSSGMVGVSRMGDSKSGKAGLARLLALCQAGIPLCYLAPRIWAECSGANDLAEPGRYQELLSEHQGETNECLTQIDLDVHRTMPTNIYFGGDGQGWPS